VAKKNTKKMCVELVGWIYMLKYDLRKEICKKVILYIDSPGNKQTLRKTYAPPEAGNKCSQELPTFQSFSTF